VVTAGLDPRNAARVLAKTTKPAAGTYMGTWSIVSDDGHKETGKFRFTVKK
jgi:methionine-rich copper-binding protein CopC